MFNGWECPRCHNIYAPNTPFCIFCWFQANSNLITSKPLNPVVALETTVDPVITPATTNVPLETTTEPTKLEATAPALLNKEKVEVDTDKYPDTKIYLMGIAHSKERAITRNLVIPYISDILQDFPTNVTSLVKKYLTYIKDNNIEYLFDNNLSTLIKQRRKVDPREVLRQYTFYINEFDIPYFFDFDCEQLLSNTELEEMRKNLINETHKRPIPVWNANLTDEDWTRMCKENDRVAIGRFTDINKLNTSDYDKIKDKCLEAHEYGTQVHAIDFSIIEPLNQHTLPFDTISSSGWSKEMRKYQTIIVNGNLEKIPIDEDTPFIETQVANLQAWVDFIKLYRGLAK